jgi:hypothetical protein
MFRRGPTSILVIGGEPVKLCACGDPFAAEYDARGQMTSRKLCDTCRERRVSRHADDLTDTAGVPRCADCTALVGLRWGTVTHLDEHGRCLACASWHAKSVARDAKERRDFRYSGGFVLRDPTRYARADH